MRSARLARTLPKRTFLRALAASLTGIGASQVIHNAEATYTPGSPADSVDRSLTVQGNLVVQSSGAGPGYVGIGTASPAGRLDVTGSVCISGATAIGTNGVLKQTYYAP